MLCIPIDLAAPRGLGEQVEAGLVGLIDHGALGTGSSVPGAVQLAQRVGASAEHVERVLDRLVHVGILQLDALGRRAVAGARHAGAGAVYRTGQPDPDSLAVWLIERRRAGTSRAAVSAYFELLVAGIYDSHTGRGE